MNLLPWADTGYSAHSAAPSAFTWLRNEPLDPGARTVSPAVGGWAGAPRWGGVAAPSALVRLLVRGCECGKHIRCTY